MSTPTGAKRGRKPRGGSTIAANSPRMSRDSPGASSAFSSPQFAHVHWALPNADAGVTESPGASTSVLQGSVSSPRITPTIIGAGQQASVQLQPSSSSQDYSFSATPSSSSVLNNTMSMSTPSSSSTFVPVLDTTGLFQLPGGSTTPTFKTTVPLPTARVPGLDEDGEGEDDTLPAMADDDYSAQQSWQSQSKDNLKVLMDNFSPDQYDRFEAYRRHALPKQAVRKVIQQVTGQQVSQPVAQVVAGFSKVFVGEIVEEARKVQRRRGDSGPLSPDHLREAYRIYQEQTGRVGAARPVRAKKLFVR